MIELIAALAKAQSEMTAAALDGVNPAFKANGKPGRYATLQSIIAAVRPALTKNAIAYTQRVEMTERGVGVETILMGHGGELRGGLVVVPLDKATAQGMGSALTYGKRYSLAAICGIAADEDDDGATAETQAPGKPALLTDDQLATLTEWLEASKTSEQQFCAAYKLPTVSALRADEFDAAIARLKKRKDAFEQREAAA